MGSQNSNDEALLLQRALAGDSDAAGKLMAGCAKRYVDVVRRMVRDREATEDILQTAQLIALRTLKQYRGDAPFVVWFFRIARNTTLMYLRKKRRTASRLDELRILLEQRQRTDKESGVDVRVESNVVSAAVENLPAGQRRVVTLHYTNSLKINEIAKLLDVNEGTVKRQLFEARCNLREALKRYNGESSQ